METSMDEVQDKILEIAVYVDDFCREHEITYYLMSGSALGAVRHKGFIPWDDDMDIFMTYDNYIKFLSACEKYLDTERFYLQRENTDEWPLLFSKIRMNNTTFIEKDTENRKMHKGFFIDVMCLNNTTKNYVVRYLQYISARLLAANTLARRGYITNSKIKKNAMALSRVLVSRPVFNGLLGVVRGLNKYETSYVGHFFGRAKFRNTSFKKSYLGVPQYIKFSTIDLPVMEHVDKYLKVRFGSDYMEIPDQKTRDKYPIHATFVDTKTDYSYYDKNEET